MSDDQQAVFENKIVDSEKNRNVRAEKLRPDTGISRFCIHCGAPLEAGDVFCCECGTKIENKAVGEGCIENYRITSDRMASIIETSSIKAGEMIEVPRKSEFIDGSLNTAINKHTLKNHLEKMLLPGYYVYKGRNMTQYLSIDDVQGNTVRATVKTNFSNLSYCTEFYEGTFSDGRLVLHITDSDLHPISGLSIMLSEVFTGDVVENSISGKFTGEFSNSVVFKKC